MAAVRTTLALSLLLTAPDAHAVEGATYAITQAAPATVEQAILAAVQAAPDVLHTTTAVHCDAHCLALEDNLMKVFFPMIAMWLAMCAGMLPSSITGGAGPAAASASATESASSAANAAASLTAAETARKAATAAAEAACNAADEAEAALKVIKAAAGGQASAGDE